MGLNDTLAESSMVMASGRRKRAPPSSVDLRNTNCITPVRDQVGRVRTSVILIFCVELFLKAN